MKKTDFLMFFCSTIYLILLTGCTSHYLTTFTPEQNIPEHLDMSYTGPKANIAVGGFTVKARGAAQYIGDGMREMLETALFESLRFNVIDRPDVKGMTAKQMLSSFKMARPGSKKLGTQMDAAELLIYGTVTEFEAEASGAGLEANLPSTQDSASAQTASGYIKRKNAHMAIDIRVVDAASGRLVAARRISGTAAFGMASVSASAEGNLSDDDIKHKIQTPLRLRVFKNTPMEMAIRDCIYRAVIYSCYAIPKSYFRH